MARVPDIPKKTRPMPGSGRPVGRDAPPPHPESDDADAADYCPTAALLAARKRTLTIWVSG
jgi:hypothetical protein